MRAEGEAPQASGPLLRSQLLRALLVPLLALLVVDAGISYGLAHRFAQQAHDKALLEVAQELSLQVRRDASGGLTIDLPETASSSARLRVTETRQRRDAMAREILAAVLLPQVLLILMAALIVRAGVGRGLRPLTELQAAVAAR
ncbi:MAG: sensor histidine kinase N-terminal domain-containing protein, partial [Rubrivivax sp.]